MVEFRILALVPARRNSKGIPLKNIKDMAGKPLIGWSIAAATESRYPMRVVCSTDDPEIGDTARFFGADAPFLRPAELATDDAPTLCVVLHALETLKEEFTHVLLLQPTSPLRTCMDIDAAIDLALSTGADAVVSVCPAQTHPYLTFKVDEDSRMTPFCRPEGVSLRRQDLPAAYELNGAVYVNRVESLLRDRTFLPPGTLAFAMSADVSVDVDDLDDWGLAERLLLERRGVMF